MFALHNNYPNPFNPITNIRYDIPEVSDVRIDIYNINGPLPAYRSTDLLEEVELYVTLSETKLTVKLRL